MSTEITTAFVEQYKSNVFHLAQQKGSRLRNAVKTENVTGKAHFFERIGSTAAEKRTSRHSDTPRMDTPHSRRKVTMDDYDWADLIDNEDKVRMLISPSSEYAMAGAWHNSAGLTLTKLLSAKEIIDSSDVDPDEPRYMIVTAKQLQNVLGVEQLTSADYASVKALVQGEIDTFLGFNFIRTERLVTDGSNRLALAFTQNAIGLALGQDITTKISERADKNYATQVFLSMSIGATRVEDEKVVEIACVES
jgi:hypothetical protein